MNFSVVSRCTIVTGLLLCAALLTTRASAQREPAVPLVTHDPYFSVWSMTDKLTDGPTRHWTGTEQPMRGLLRVDGKSYRVMGDSPREVPAMNQTAMEITPTHTRYSFEGAGVRCVLTFLSPLLPDEFDVMARPVTYVTWQVSATDGAKHTVEAYLDVDSRIAVNSQDQFVVWGRSAAKGLQVMSVGSQEQRVLNRSGDNLRADWGYFHLAIPTDEQATSAMSGDTVRSFVHDGTLPEEDDVRMPRVPTDGAVQLAVALPMNVSGSHAVERHVLLSFTQDYAIEYLNRRLRPYWARDGKTSGTMLAESERDYAAVDAKAVKFDKELVADMERVGGKDYARLTALAYRQTLAANGFAADVDGRPLQFPKENFSNGCISTVDVLYPSAPFFLFFNPALLEAQLKPVMDYAASGRWRWPFAPHDLGQYPLANGQVYGGGERTEEDQMPVEESGNMLIMIAAMGRAQGDMHFAKTYWPLLTKWAEYLREKGLDPENQLSTDDFAGHLAHNANLSIKAIDALGAYAEMAQELGHADEAKAYAGLAKTMAAQWETMAHEGDHYKLAFDSTDTWSQKYNLVWDKVLRLNLFPTKVRETELAFYAKHMNRYGLPLDSRKTYTKLDWEIWTATLADSPQQFESFTAPIAAWLDDTPSRVPLTDWYDTLSGKQQGFQARSVVGGVYMKALSDDALAKKWRNHAQSGTSVSHLQ
ncbi:glutaminase family protein [Granulicella mallensis]|uniref:Glutaminase n=1 Tax=Granulicella mallensis (strain ATCC BAA-1857 / DSM 23137 / MP5ACTX8) TaxID=682795 RepID=G8NUG0_GRAMM|nr:protein of unknown function DUF1793 [Granulicella mallensis MP5ACTX8]